MHQILSCVMILLLTIFVLLANGAKQTPISEADLNCDTKNNFRIDGQMAKIMVMGEHGRKYPEDRKQLKVFCE